MISSDDEWFFHIVKIHQINRESGSESRLPPTRLKGREGATGELQPNRVRRLASQMAAPISAGSTDVQGWVKPWVHPYYPRPRMRIKADDEIDTVKRKSR